MLNAIVNTLIANKKEIIKKAMLISVAAFGVAMATTIAVPNEGAYEIDSESDNAEGEVVDMDTDDYLFIIF